MEPFGGVIGPARALVGGDGSVQAVPGPVFASAMMISSGFAVAGQRLASML
ncbi:MAG: hypothetical protein AB3N06_06595 [Erythrobacter sp.]